MKPDWPWEVRALLILPEQNYSDESLLGYLARVADENFLPSVGALLAPVKLRVKGRYSSEELLEMSSAWVCCWSTYNSWPSLAALRAPGLIGVAFANRQ